MPDYYQKPTPATLLDDAIKQIRLEEYIRGMYEACSMMQVDECIVLESVTKPQIKNIIEQRAKQVAAMIEARRAELAAIRGE